MTFEEQPSSLPRRFRRGEGPRSKMFRIGGIEAVMVPQPFDR